MTLHDAQTILGLFNVPMIHLVELFKMNKLKMKKKTKNKCVSDAITLACNAIIDKMLDAVLFQDHLYKQNSAVMCCSYAN